MKDIEKLIHDHKRLIESEAYKNAKFIPLSFVTVEAYRLAREAAHKFDESMGIKFSTYLTNSLQKLQRISTSYGGAVRVPENKQFKINKMNQIEQDLHEQLGRAPNVSELADATGLGIQAVSNLLGTRKKDINLNNLAYSPVFFEGEENDWVHFVYHDLTDKDKLIFEHRTGFGGKKMMDTAELAKLLGVSPSTISQRIKVISDKLEEGFHG